MSRQANLKQINNQEQAEVRFNPETQNMIKNLNIATQNKNISLSSRRQAERKQRNPKV